VAQAPKEVPVVVAKAKKSEFSDAIEALGTLRANEAVDLTAKVTETVARINFEDGDQVKKGEILVEMVTGQEEALLDEARATADEAKRRYERATQLAKSGASATEDLDEARRIFQTTRARLAAIESQIGDRVIKAPFDGVVGLRNISVGALVQPGDLITTIDDNSVMKLDFSVPTTFLANVQPGTPITASSRAFPGETFDGAIASVGSRIDPVTRSVIVRAHIPNPDYRLKPGLLMTVKIFSNPRKTLVLPEEALLPRGRENSVFVLDSSTDPPTIQKRGVQIGQRRRGEVEVLEGLEPGDKVVTRGAMTASPGAAVEIVAESTGGETLQELLDSPAAAMP